MTNDEESVENLKARATDLLSRLHSLPANKLSPSALSRISKLISSELRFLRSHLHSPLNSTNLGYLEAVVQVLQHPHVDAVSAVFHKFNVLSSDKSIDAHVDIVCTFQVKPVWIVVSDRNPDYLYWSEECNGLKNWKNRVRQLVLVAQSLDVLRPTSILFCFARGVAQRILAGFEEAIGARHIDLYQEQNFKHGDYFDDFYLISGRRLIEKDDGDWVYIHVSTERVDLGCWITFQVDINSQFDPLLSSICEGCQHSEERLTLKDSHQNAEISMLDHKNCKSVAISEQQHEGIHLHDGIDYHSGACNELFFSCLERICRQSIPLIHKQFTSSTFLSNKNLVNLDTTALIALVSEVSNGAASFLISMSDEDLVFRFKSTAQFMKNQAIEEIKRPLIKDMETIFENRMPFMSETVCTEFKSLVSLCGSFKEKIRAEELLLVLLVVPDTPSTRIRSLCETGKIKKKNKMIFGTGDFWQAPTLTANLSFVRAVRQTGMALSILEHHPRALVGEKCS